MQPPPAHDAPCWADIFARRFGAYTPAKWQSFFGLAVYIVGIVWSVIPSEDKVYHSLQPCHLLWFLSWIHCYETLPVAAAQWGVDPKTYQRRVAQMLDVLERHLDFIHWEDRIHGAPLFGVGFAVVDATLCPLEVNRKEWDDQKPYFSPKHGMHGLKYEIAVHWQTGHIVWVRGGVPGSVHDLTLTRNTGLMRQLLPGELLFADKGYIGEPQIVTPFKGRRAELPPQQLAWNDALNPHRTIVENSLRRICKFRILKVKFRGNDITDHHQIFCVCAQLAQLDIFFHPLRTTVLEDPDRPHGA